MIYSTLADVKGLSTSMQFLTARGAAVGLEAPQ